MSETTSRQCNHEFSEPVNCDATGDSVEVCCDCGEVLRFKLPDDPREGHWFDNPPHSHPHMRLAADVLDDLEPPRPNERSERIIQICGGCGHWLSAAHGAYFAHEINTSTEGGFTSLLSETLCPDCGAALFRYGSVVMRYGDAVMARKECDNFARKYVCSRANARFWHGNERCQGALKSSLADIGYEPRCPCCGFAKAYSGREFDFHHWDYQDDIGCMLCRECHSHIHRGMRAGEQAELSDGWRRDAIRRLHSRSLKNGLEFNKPHNFTFRFNITSPDKDLQSYIGGLLSR